MVDNQKHAYLIMAHNNFEQLKILIGLLDDYRNDIYLHIDKKVKGFVKESIQTKYAQLIFVNPINVTWGGHSQIKCEMLLLKSSKPKHYKYYHILSGVDLPIKTQDEIHDFFDLNYGKNFIDFDTEANTTKNYIDRVQYYHLFRNIIGRSKKIGTLMFRVLNKFFLMLQKSVSFKRKEIIPNYKGSNWVSITDEMAQYLVKCEKLIRKQFYYSYCADEIFLQSVAMSSPYRDTIIDCDCRIIDWERGKPYTYRKNDAEELFNSTALFARKFDLSVDKEIIDLVVEKVGKTKI